MSGNPQYDDGLDDDGYPLPAPGLRYRHGSVEDVPDDWRPVSLGEVTAKAFLRILSILELSPTCDSPIEAQLGTAVIEFFERAGTPLKLCKMIDIREGFPGLLFVPQFAWGYYRSDWAILDPTRCGALLIECDGKEFHSSPKQKDHDAKKDAAALDRGFLTMRFTGSQIYRDADGCAQKIYDAVCGG